MDLIKYHNSVTWIVSLVLGSLLCVTITNTVMGHLSHTHNHKGPIHYSGQNLTLHSVGFNDFILFYRVCHNIVYTFVFWIYQLPRGLQIPSWTFFNSPFCVDFKNIQFFIIWLNMDWYITKILEGSHLKLTSF